jgi:hypothetical protein
MEVLYKLFPKVQSIVKLRLGYTYAIRVDISFMGVGFIFKCFRGHPMKCACLSSHHLSRTHITPTKPKVSNFNLNKIMFTLNRLSHQ